MMLVAQKDKNLLPIRSHVDVILLCHESNLLRVQPRESEHSNLLDNVAPITRCA